MNYVQLWEDIMTAIDLEHPAIARADSGKEGPPAGLAWATGFIETVCDLGLRLAGCEAWAAVGGALVAAGLLVGMAHVAIALINPALAAIVPVNCATSLDCARQTMGMLP